MNLEAPPDWLLEAAVYVGSALGAWYWRLRARVEAFESRGKRIEAALVDVLGILRGTAEKPGLLERVSLLERPAAALPSTARACDGSPTVKDSERDARR